MSLLLAGCLCWSTFGITSARGCSPAGHAFVANAAVHRLQQSSDPEVRKLARVLHKYRWVVYWAAEGPDVVQNDRGYQASHWFPLYAVDYEHPERFDLATAQPCYTALFRHAYRLDYGVPPEDVTRHAITAARQPRPDWREVSLAFACGYTTHLLSDYFCHAPAKVWWDNDPKLRESVRKVCHGDSFGFVQEIHAVMLWERLAKTYGLPDDPIGDFQRHLPSHHVDNGVLPYCALAGSKRYYADWPPRAAEAADPSKYDLCAAHMLQRTGHGYSDCVAQESRRVHAMLDQIGLPLDRAIQVSDDLTHWQATYDRVIRMIVTIWTQAAAQIGLAEPDEVNVVLAESEKPGAQKSVLVVPAESHAQISLAVERSKADARFRTRKGAQGPVTEHGKPPSGARFQVGTVSANGRRRVAILTDGPWLLGPGEVRGVYRVRLPANRKLVFTASCGLEPGTTAKSDGVTFRVLLTDRSQREQELWARHVRQTWEPIRVDLTPWAGQEIELALAADSGPRDDFGWDMGAWVEPRICVAD